MPPRRKSKTTTAGPPNKKAKVVNSDSELEIDDDETTIVNVTQSQQDEVIENTESESSADEEEEEQVPKTVNETPKGDSTVPKELLPENNNGKLVLMAPTEKPEGSQNQVATSETSADARKKAAAKENDDASGNDSDDDDDEVEEEDAKIPAKISANSFVGNKTEVELNFSDDDDSEDEDNQTGRKSKYPIKITRVNSDGGISGFVFHLTGYADKKMGDILWNRLKVKKYRKFLSAIGSASWVCKVLQPGSATEYVKNNKGWPLRGCAVVCAEGTKPEKEAIIDWFDNVFIKAFEAINAKEDDKLKPYAMPGIDDEQTWFNDVTNWKDAVGEQESINAVVTRNLELNKGGKMKVFLNQSSKNIYSLYPHGCVPKEVYKIYGIRAELLHDLDKAKLIKGKKKKAPPASA